MIAIRFTILGTMAIPRIAVTKIGFCRKGFVFSAERTDGCGLDLPGGKAQVGETPWQCLKYLLKEASMNEGKIVFGAPEQQYVSSGIVHIILTLQILSRCLFGSKTMFEKSH